MNTLINSGTVVPTMPTGLCFCPLALLSLASYLYPEWSFLVIISSLPCYVPLYQSL
jgi:hypothetical protein